MRIKIQNKYGSFEIGGGSHKNARLLEIAGLGLPTIEPETVSFAGQPGYVISSKTDTARTITMSLDLLGCPFDVMKLYNILKEKCEILFFFGSTRRKIYGICLNPCEAEKIIYKRMYKIVLQFVCENPYFTDIHAPQTALATRVDMFPTSYEDGMGYITIPAVATVRESERTVINSGDVPVYPLLKAVANGDMEYILFENLTTGAFIKLEYAICEGEEITVDVVNREITSSIYGNVLNKQTSDTVISSFYLEEGENSLRVTSDTLSPISISISFANQYKAVMIE